MKNNGNIFNQDGRYINVLRPTDVAAAGIYSEAQRQQIQLLIHHNFLPHHTAVGKGRCTKKHWNLEKYRGKHGVGFKMITTRPYSYNFNHLTYFIKEAV